MKKSLLFLLITLMAFQLAQAQEKVVLNIKLEGTLTSQIAHMPEGARVLLLGFIDSREGLIALLNYDNVAVHVPTYQLNHIYFHPKDITEFWIVKAIENQVYHNILKNGYQFPIRNEITEEVGEYMKYLSNNDLIFNDSYLENYLNSLLYRILPERIHDGRPGFVKIILVKDASPNAGIYSDGTLIVNTGLLSSINSEEELIAVLAHEIAHFVLDHSVQNINAAIRRQHRAEFWSSVATGIVSMAESYTASKNPNYNPGYLTWYTSQLAWSLSLAINERLGLNYSKKQEMEADKCAVDLLNSIGVDPAALSSVLLKTKDYNSSTNNYQAILGEGTHPAIEDRIKLSGAPKEFATPGYDQKISFVNTFNAQSLVYNKNYEAAQNLAFRNIDAGVATEDDYLVLVAVNLARYYNALENEKALEYIRIAKELNIDPGMDIIKQEALIYLRLNKIREAEGSLLNYRDSLAESLRMNAGDMLYLDQEYEWTLKMLAKIHLL